jgi:hypothetical protein
MSKQANDEYPPKEAQKRRGGASGGDEHATQTPEGHD